MSLAFIADAVITVDISGNIDYLNPAAEALLGWPLKEALGQPLPSIFHATDDVTGMAIANPFGLIMQQQQQHQLQDKAVLVPRSQLQQAIIYSAAPIRSANGDIIRVVVVIKPIQATQTVTSEPPLPASHDALTGLFNRSQFEQRMEELIEAAHCHDRRHALLYLNLDSFSIVNRTAGVSAGDELLRKLSAVLNARIRGSDTLARLDGDAFGVLLVDCPLDNAVRVAQSLRSAVAEFRFIWQDQAYTLGISVGVVPIAGKREDNTDLIHLAKAACQTTKENRRSQVMAGCQVMAGF